MHGPAAVTTLGTAVTGAGVIGTAAETDVGVVVVAEKGAVVYTAGAAHLCERVCACVRAHACTCARMRACRRPELSSQTSLRHSPQFGPVEDTV